MLCSLPHRSPPSCILSLLPAALGTVFRDSALTQPGAEPAGQGRRAVRLAGCAPLPCGIARRCACGEPAAGHGSGRSCRLLLQALLLAVDCAAAKVSDLAFQTGKGMCVAHPRAKRAERAGWRLPPSFPPRCCRPGGER